MKYLVYLLLFLAFTANSQTVEFEKTFDVSKEAMKGVIQQGGK
ncbi:MAG: hypothetical protein WDN75_18660 [Bacteroidota bacterium]